MAEITLKNINLSYPILGSSSKSLRSRLVKNLTGGVLESSKNDIVFVNALRNINLTLTNGDKIGLIGHNGSGKTTLLRLMAGILEPSSGIIRRKGKISCLINPSAGLNPEATGLENIFLRSYLLGMTHHDVKKKLNQIIAFADLGKFIDLPMRTYSSGMVSRLSYSITTAIEPDILLVDEGIGAGDANFQEKIKKNTIEFLKKSKIVVFASHNLNFLKEINAKIIKLEKGLIIQ
jgi:ABC-type polysaccharide/polyol phosphate transport system ATPase subunit